MGLIYWPNHYEEIQLSKQENRRARIRHQCRRTTVLSYHRCLINTGVEKIEQHFNFVRILTARCLYGRVNVGIQTILCTF